MHLSKKELAGLAAGFTNGLLGAGGGMVLVPILSRDAQIKEREVFPCSVAIILPICLTSLTVQSFQGALPWQQALPYLLGAVPGGILAGIFGQRIPTKWLHRALGILILVGGIRYLWT